MIVSKELIRVAILWHELWHEGLEEASRLFFSEKNPPGMIAVLEPLHDMLEAVGHCLLSASLVVLFGSRDLQPLERQPLLKDLEENSGKLEKQPVVIAHTVTLAN